MLLILLFFIPIIGIISIVTTINSVNAISYSRQIKLIATTLMFYFRFRIFSIGISPSTQGIFLAVIISILSYIFGGDYIYCMENPEGGLPEAKDLLRHMQLDAEY